MLAVLSKGYSEVNASRLESELIKLLSSNVKEKAAKGFKITETSHVRPTDAPIQGAVLQRDQTPGNSNINKPDDIHLGDDSVFLSTVLEKVKNERIQAYRTRGFYHSQLSIVLTDEERYELAKKIQELMLRIRELNGHFDQLNAGSIPRIYQVTELTAEQYVRVKNLKQYISTYKRKIPTATSLAQKEKWEQIIVKYIEELNQFI